MADGTYKFIKENSSGYFDEKAVQAESGKVLGFDANLNPLMLTPGTGGNADLVEDTTPQLGGDLDINGKSIDWGVVISTNTIYKGETISVVVDSNSNGFGALLAQGDDFHFQEADASAMANCNMIVMALEPGTGTKKVLLKGQVCNTAWNWVNGPLYASETAGEITQSLPSVEDAVVAALGWALSGNTIYFNPYNAWAAITSAGAIKSILGVTLPSADVADAMLFEEGSEFYMVEEDTADNYLQLVEA